MVTMVAMHIFSRSYKKNLEFQVDTLSYNDMEIHPFSFLVSKLKYQMNNTSGRAHTAVRM